MMPSAEYSGLRLPIAGARPIIFSSVLDGPNSCSHASATTCGAIISGSTKQNTNALRRADIGERDDQRDDRADHHRQQRAAECGHQAVPRRGPGRRRSTDTRVALPSRTARWGRCPRAAAARAAAARARRRSRRAPTAARYPRRARASLRRRPSKRARSGPQLPKSSAKRFRLALLVCTTLPMSVGIRLIFVPGGSHDGVPTLALAGM